MKIRLIFASLLSVVLCACGGGGDSGSTASTVAFTAFSDVQPGQSVRADGQSQTQNVTQISGIVTAQSMNTPDLNGVSAKWTYGPGSPLVLTGIEFSTPRTGVMWNNGRGAQTVTCDAQFCSASGEGAAGVLVNAFGSVGWNFQTFGYWLADTGLPANIAANISAGKATLVSGVPTTGTFTYNGISGGLYVDPTGVLQEHNAVMSAVVNFDPFVRTINFLTTGTTTRPWNSGGGLSPATTLNISGVLTYAAGTNSFTGTATMGPTGSPTMSGDATGVFYGPNAEEIGGTFRLTSTSASGSVESITGSFGGKR